MIDLNSKEKRLFLEYIEDDKEKNGENSIPDTCPFYILIEELDMASSDAKRKTRLKGGCSNTCRNHWNMIHKACSNETESRYNL